VIAGLMNNDRHPLAIFNDLAPDETPMRRPILVKPQCGGPKPTSECCVSLIWMVMQGGYTGIYPGSGKRRPYVQRGGGSIVFPCTEVLA
jgi:hypothetical protein